VIALADVDLDRLGRVAELFGVDRRYGGHADLLADETIEAVGVCVPAAEHLEVGLAALDAGKHLLLEKPIALSLGEADRWIDRAARSSRKAILGFNLRWHRLVQRTRALLARGVIGNPTLLRAALTSYHEVIPDWRIRRASGGGVFFA
jgi:predicted dehydrogenase